MTRRFGSKILSFEVIEIWFDIGFKILNYRCDCDVFSIIVDIVKVKIQIADIMTMKIYFVYTKYNKNVYNSYSFILFSINSFISTYYYYIK